eukprot:g45114.t1
MKVVGGGRRGLYDCIGAALRSYEELEQFHHFTNTFHSDLNFTCTIFDTSLPFLDLSVIISCNRLNTDINFKLTNSHSYLDYTYSDPPSCKNAIPYSPFLRICRICVRDDAFHSRTSQISSYVKDCNFPSPVIHNALNRISFTCVLKPPPPNNKDTIPLVLTYHPTNLGIQCFILCYFGHQQSNPPHPSLLYTPAEFQNFDSQGAEASAVAITKQKVLGKLKDQNVEKPHPRVLKKIAKENMEVYTDLSGITGIR